MLARPVCMESFRVLDSIIHDTTSYGRRYANMKCMDLYFVRGHNYVTRSRSL